MVDKSSQMVLNALSKAAAEPSGLPLHGGAARQVFSHQQLPASWRPSAARTKAYCSACRPPATPQATANRGPSPNAVSAICSVN